MHDKLSLDTFQAKASRAKQTERLVETDPDLRNNSLIEIVYNLTTVFRECRVVRSAVIHQVLRFVIKIDYSVVDIFLICLSKNLSTIITTRSASRYVIGK